MPEVKPITPSRLDWLIYRLFYWRWNRILSNNPELLSFFSKSVDDWREQCPK